jgi:hypothetical protein
VVLKASWICDTPACWLTAPTSIAGGFSRQCTPLSQNVEVARILALTCSLQGQAIVHTPVAEWYVLYTVVCGKYDIG